MISRRILLLSSLLATTSLRPASAQKAQPSDPAAIVTAIYTRVAKGKGDSGGTFVFQTKADKAKYLSKSLIALWAKADAHTQKGDIGPIEFDPVTNSQDPDVTSFKVVTDKLEADKAIIAVTMTGRQARTKPVDDTVRYDFVLDGGAWKIDDIRGAIEAEPWSVRGMLADFLKA
jgi:hypothetical protein